MKPKSTLRHFLCIASSAVLTIFYAHAASNVTWDITPGTVGIGNSAITGGTGAWNTADGNWTIDAGANNIAWDNLNNDTAIFGGTFGTVTLGTGITVGGLTFDTAGYTVADNTLTFGIAGNIAANANATISSILAGSSAITKTGVGTLSLNATNTYNGVTTINQGALNATTFAPGGSNSSIGSAAVAETNLILNGGTLGHNAANVATTNRLFSVGTSNGGIDSSAASATNTLSFTATTAFGFNNQLGTRTLTLRGSNTGNNTMGVLISNDGSGNATSLTKSDAGTWILNNNSNSYTGVTTITGGALVLTSATALPGGIGIAGGTSNLTFNGGVLGLGFGNFTRDLNSAATTTAATFTGAGGWAAYGADRVVNLNNDSHEIIWATADTGLNNQTLILGNVSATHTVDFQNAINLGTATRTVQVNDGAAAVDAIMSGNISGTGGRLSKTGSGTLSITGNMSQTEGLTVSTTSGSTLNLSGTNTYSSTTINAFSNPATGLLVFQGIQALSPNTSLQQTHTSGAGGFGTIRILDDSATPASRSTVNINMFAANTSHGMPLFVGNNNTANGGGSSGSTTGSTITLGNLNFTQTNNDNNSQSLNVTNANGYKLQIGSVNVSLQAGSGAWTANLVADAPLTVTGNVQQAAGSPGTTTLALQGGATGSLISGNILNSLDGTPKVLTVSKSGGGTWTLSGTNAYSGATTVTGGTLATTSAVQGFGTNLSGISIGGSGTLKLVNDSSVSFTNGTSAYHINNSASAATINVDRVTGTGTNKLTVGNLTTSSTAVTWQLNFAGANGVGLNASTLTTPTAAAGSHTINNNIADGGILTLAGVTGGGTGAAATLIVTGTANTTVSGAITQVATNQALTKNGAGTLLLNGTNTYTGLTSVNAGTLGGTGTIAGNVTVASAGSLAPGASAGTLSIGGVLNISLPANGGAGKLKFELGPIAASDKIALTGSGSLTIGGNFLGFSDFTFSTLSGLQNGTYKLITSSNAFSGGLDTTPANLTGPIGAGTGILQITGNDVELLVSGIGAGSAYDTWATSKGLTGANNGKGDNPDNDGLNNLGEFAFDGDPLSGANDGKIVGKVATVSAAQVMTLTLPVRNGASFSASSGDQLSALIDGIYYRIEGDVSLSPFADTITEVTGGDATTIQTGLPALTSGWTYRTFRAPGTVPATPKAFLRAKISETP